jgi:hypothetical protein
MGTATWTVSKSHARDGRERWRNPSPSHRSYGRPLLIGCNLKPSALAGGVVFASLIFKHFERVVETAPHAIEGP